jgi:hypothetical protein
MARQKSSGQRAPSQVKNNSDKKKFQHPPTDPRRAPRIGTVVGGPAAREMSYLGPSLSNSMTASSLSDSHYHGQFAMSSLATSQSSSSDNYSQSTRGGAAARHNNTNRDKQQSQSQSHYQQQQQQRPPIQHAVTPNKSYVSSSSSGSTSQKLYYTSPRIELDDTQIFPSSPVKRHSLKTIEDRWNYVGEQAGSHRQDSTVLHVSRRHMTPSVLKAGVPPQVANRIKELHLRLEQAEDMLPEWLDVIAQKFTNLEHLYLARDTPTNANAKAAKPAGLDSPSNQPTRLRRLYILYRLPHLASIDGVAVTKSERRLARPDDPNGQRVSKEEWVPLGGGKGEDGKKQANSTSKDKAAATAAKHNNSGKKDDVTRGIRNILHGVAEDDDNDDDDEEDDHDQADVGLEEILSSSEEGYELGLDLTNAINRITDPNNRSNNNNRPLSPGGRHTGDEHRDDQPESNNKSQRHQHHHQSSQRKPSKNNKPLASSTPKSPKKSNKPKPNKPRNSSNNKNTKGDTADTDDEPTLEYVECDSTVTSAYGYGHWSGACFAPFQVCNSRTRKKTKQAFAARNSKHHGSNSSNNNNNNRTTTTLRLVALTLINTQTIMLLLLRNHRNKFMLVRQIRTSTIIQVLPANRTSQINIRLLSQKQIKNKK